MSRTVDGATIKSARGMNGQTLGASITSRLAKYRRLKLAAAGFFVVASCIIVALLAPYLAPFDPLKQDLNATLQAPSQQHLFGTDDLGRDVLSRVIFGARASLSVGIFSVALALIVGLPLGLISGYYGRHVDQLIMRVMDALMAFPTVVLALAIVALLGPNLTNATLAVGIVSIPIFARLVRGQVLIVRELDFVSAARALGSRDRRIIFLHVLPNSISPAVIQACLAVSFSIILEASLSFLGVGVQPPTPSWGGMLKNGYGYLEMAPWLSITPGLALFWSSLGFALLGDSLRDVLDPRVRSWGK